MAPFCSYLTPYASQMLLFNDVTGIHSTQTSLGFLNTLSPPSRLSDLLVPLHSLSLGPRILWSPPSRFCALRPWSHTQPFPGLLDFLGSCSSPLCTLRLLGFTHSPFLGLLDPLVPHVAIPQVLRCRSQLAAISGLTDTLVHFSLLWSC